MYMAYMNKIHLVFLPPHTSHILQPLDLTIFDAMKSSYKTNVLDFVALSNDLDVKKRHFIRFYAEARLQLTEKHILSGFKSAGIEPFNPNKTKLSSQVQQPPSQATPPSNKTIDHLTILTPYKPTEAHRQIRLITPSTIGILGRKISKALASKDMELALMKRRLEATEERLFEHTISTKRRRVKYDPSQAFASADEIIEAQAKMGVLDDNGDLMTTAVASELPNQAIPNTSYMQFEQEIRSMLEVVMVDPNLQ
jgi:4-hydroxybenzoate polyprenyltransferase